MTKPAESDEPKTGTPLIERLVYELVRGGEVIDVVSDERAAVAMALADPTLRIRAKLEEG